MKNESCPCPNLKCRHHGVCADCRAHHAGAEKPRPCGFFDGADAARSDGKNNTSRP